MQWYWEDWSTVHAHDFTDTDYRRDRWGVLKLPIGDALYELTEGYNTRTFPYICRLWFEIDWSNPFCETAFLKFYYDYALDWLAGASATEQRRIRFYPAGLGQFDRFGNDVDPLLVVIEKSENFWDRHSQWGGRRGAYEGVLVLSSYELFTPGTYPFTSDNWQYYIPWSEAMPVS